MTSGRLGRAARMTCDTRAEEKRPKGRALISLAERDAPFSLGEKPALNRKSLANLPRKRRRKGATDRDR